MILYVLMFFFSIFQVLGKNRVVRYLLTSPAILLSICFWPGQELKESFRQFIVHPSVKLKFVYLHISSSGLSCVFLGSLLGLSWVSLRFLSGLSHFFFSSFSQISVVPYLQGLLNKDHFEKKKKLKGMFKDEFSQSFLDFEVRKQ